MRKIPSLIVASIIGSGITLGAFSFLTTNNFEQREVVHVVEKPVAIQTSMNGIREGAMLTDFTGAAEKSMSAVVHIKSLKTKMTSQYQALPDPFRELFGGGTGGRYYREKKMPQLQASSGSGVIINGGGYIITNNHVIDGADELEVSLHDNRKFKAEVIGTDPSTDLALIKIEEEGLPFLNLVNSDQVKVGEWVLAVGNPFNLNSTVTAGIVSAKARNINILKDKKAVESFIQTDAAVNPGNSGGALVNMKGELVGINTAIASPTGSFSGYSFAVPSNIVSKVVEDILEFGIVQRGYLGVYISDLDGSRAKELNIDFEEGVYVEELIEGGSAEDAGIEKGDVLKEINGHRIKSTPQLQEAVATRSPGDLIEVVVSRSGKEKRFNVTLKNSSGSTSVVNKEKVKTSAKLGVELGKIDSEKCKALGIKNGVRIESIDKGAIQNQSQIKEGFIVTHVDDAEVKNIDHFLEIISKRKGGILLQGIYESKEGFYYYGIGLK